MATPDMPASMTEVKVTAKAPDSLLAPDVDLTPPAVGDPSAVVNKQLADDADFLSIEAADFSDPQKRGFFGRTYDRLAAEGARVIREAPAAAMDKLGDTITNIPSQYAQKAVGLRPDPVYNQTSYATVVPTIQEAPLVGTTPTVNPVDYISQNASLVNSQPFGYNAIMYNDATYLNSMRKYGFA